MKDFKLERLSIDLTNYCSKECEFCYNHSSMNGISEWKSKEVVSMILDCQQKGLKAVSLGGGEPFEYSDIFNVISQLTPHVFVSVTTNGLPLLNKEIFEKLKNNKPDKIHITIHQPENLNEIHRTIFLLQKIGKLGIKTGVNIFISVDKINECKILTQILYKFGLNESQLIFVARKYNLCPTPKQVAEVAGRNQFQSASCLTDCKRSQQFCSVSFDKKVNFCSYSPSKETLKEYTYNAIIEALNKIDFKTCQI